MYLKLLTIAFFLFLSIESKSSGCYVHGKLEEKNSKIPVEFATIAVFSNSNDSLITSVITDSKGEFAFLAGAGNYRIRIRCLGYKSMEETIKIDKMDLYLKPIALEVDNQAIAQIDITASSYREQYDMSIQTITKQFNEGTNSASDLLAKIKGVNVDLLDNSVSVDNKKSVLLMVDGVKKDQEYIKNLSPDRISRIELSRNPTGRFISDGYTSVVNIILKKNFTGYSAHIEEKGLFSLDKSNGDDVLFNNTASADFTYTVKKTNYYGSYSITKSNNNLLTESLKTIDEISLLKRPINDSPNSKKDALFHNYLMGTDIFISPTQSLSIEANFIQSPSRKNKTTKDYNNILEIPSGSEEFFSSLITKQNDNRLFFLTSYRNSLSEKSKLEIDYGSLPSESFDNL